MQHILSSEVHVSIISAEKVFLENVENSESFKDTVLIDLPDRILCKLPGVKSTTSKRNAKRVKLSSDQVENEQCNSNKSYLIVIIIIYPYPSSLVDHYLSLFPSTGADDHTTASRDQSAFPNLEALQAVKASSLSLLEKEVKMKELVDRFQQNLQSEKSVLYHMTTKNSQMMTLYKPFKDEYIRSNAYEEGSRKLLDALQKVRGGTLPTTEQIVHLKIGANHRLFQLTSTFNPGNN